MFGFVEDPGSANFFVGLSDALADGGVGFDLTAADPALAYLGARGVHPRPWAGDAEIASALCGSDLVLVGTSENRESPAFALIDAARRHGVPSVAIVDAPSSIAERFRMSEDGAGGCRPDYVVSAQNEACETIEALGIATRDVCLVRHPYLDALEKVGAELATEDRDELRTGLFGDAAAGKRIVVFLCEISDGLVSSDFLRSPDYTLQGGGDSDKRTHIVLDEVLDALQPDREDVFLVLRLHPKDTAKEYEAYAGRADWISQAEDPLRVVGLADAVVGMTTNLLTEAAVLGTPVLSVVPRPMERDWVSQMTRPPIPVVWTRSGLRAGLRDLLAGSRSERQRVDLDRPGLADCLMGILGRERDSRLSVMKEMK